MQQKSNYQKIIFGLKVKQLRQAKGLLFGEFAERTKISMSYLNEIEKGKKFPKEDKIEVLAQVLDTTPEELCSENMSKNLTPLGDLLNSNFLNELPLDLFGIDFQKVVEIIAEAPIKVGAFISTLVELGRTYALREENFYYRALRAYQELHNNYFEEIEKIADRFLDEKQNADNQLFTSKKITDILTKEFGTKIIENGLTQHSALQHFRAVAIPEQNTLLLNGLLSENQKTYQLAKELGFRYLNITQRSISGLRANTFEEVLNNYKAAYFAVAILMPRENFIKDIREWFEMPHYDANFLPHLLEKYQVSAETLFQRFNVLPRFFGIEKLFFLRFIHNTDNDNFEIDKELHLHNRHQPHSNGLNEDYCRRWLATSLVKDLHLPENKGNKILSSVQKSRYIDSKDEYLCFTVAKSSSPSPNRDVSVTIGLQIDASLRKKIKFLNDPAISEREVGVTCQRCAVKDCKERISPPIRLEERAKRKKIQDTLQALGTK
jgi:XRE family transcriptional regulator, fatty acid utilization regulator